MFINDSFADRVHPEPNTGCWLWTGGTTSCGYGCYATHRRKTGRSGLTHRISYEFTFGPIPDGMEIDHTCRQRLCCNPDHLRVLSPAENKAMAVRKRKSVCVNGHQMTADNVYLSKTNRQHCKACNRERARARRARRKGVIS